MRDASLPKPKLAAEIVHVQSFVISLIFSFYVAI